MKRTTVIISILCFFIFSSILPAAAANLSFGDINISIGLGNQEPPPPPPPPDQSQRHRNPEPRHHHNDRGVRGCICKPNCPCCKKNQCGPRCKCSKTCPGCRESHKTPPPHRKK